MPKPRESYAQTYGKAMRNLRECRPCCCLVGLVGRAFARLLNSLCHFCLCFWYKHEEKDLPKLSTFRRDCGRHPVSNLCSQQPSATERRASSRELREAKEVECRISGRTAADLMLLGLLGSALPALEAAQAQLMAPTVP